MSLHFRNNNCQKYKSPPLQISERVWKNRNFHTLLNRNVIDITLWKEIWQYVGNLNMLIS